MFDNFGVGEFFMLAVFALLFFGPERLPQLGAKLGQWLGKLTQQSKLFMNQWREEALVIHDAVSEVKGIRDEIIAAQRQITSTMSAAQGDITESLDQVKGTVSGSRVSFDQIAAEAKAEERAKQVAKEAAKSQSDVEAIEKTQAILAGLDSQPSDASLEQETPPVDETSPVEPLPETPPVEEEKKLDARDQTAQILAAMQTKLGGDTIAPAASEPPVESPPEIPAEPDTQIMISGERVVGATVDKKQGPGAIDQTSQIMANLQAKLSGEPVVEEPAIETLVVESLSEEPEPEDEWTRTRNLIQAGMSGKPKFVRAATQPPAAKALQEPEPVPPTGESTVIEESAASPSVTRLDNSSKAEIAVLNDQVSTLQGEIHSLRQALDALRAEMMVKTALPPVHAPLSRAPTAAREESL